MPKRDRWNSGDEDSPTKSLLNREQLVSTEDVIECPVASVDDARVESSALSTKTTNEVSHGCSLYNPLLHGCRSVYDSYERIDRMDEGTYGVVWKARDNSTGKLVALKQIKFDSDMTKEGFPISALREIGVLLSLSHECIVTVNEMVVGNAPDKVFMVMECMEMDLQAAMKSGPGASTPFAQSEIKSMMHQLLSAMAHVHDHWFLHRDVKTSNILVHKSGRIALCDFGLARKYEIPPRNMTLMVVTLWYRAPELLFGESKYGTEIDMWSIGCIFGELLVKDAILKGSGELDQIQKIFRLVGTPTNDNWPEFVSLPNAGTFKWKSKDKSELERKFKVHSFSATGQSYLDPNGFNLMSRLLELNPRKRVSAQDALNHAYFREGIAMQVPIFFQ